MVCKSQKVKKKKKKKTPPLRVKSRETQAREVSGVIPESVAAKAVGIDLKDLNGTKKNQNRSTVLRGSWTHGIVGFFTHKGQINQELILATKLQFGFLGHFPPTI